MRHNVVGDCEKDESVIYSIGNNRDKGVWSHGCDDASFSRSDVLVKWDETAGKLQRRVITLVESRLEGMEVNRLTPLVDASG